MNVLVSGAAGFLGSHLCDKLVEKGYKVFGVDNLISGRKENLQNVIKKVNFTFINHSVNERLELKEKLNIIFHFASVASPLYYLNYPIETMLANSIGTYNLLEICRLNNSRFILASTSEIYGDPLKHPQKEDYWGNVNPIGPRSVYDESKRFAESLSMAYFRKYGLDIRIVRIFNTYGPRMRTDDGRVIPNFIQKALKNEYLEIYGDGSQTRSFCYVDDLLDGVMRIALKENLDAEVFNLGNTAEITILELASLVIRLTSSKSSIVFGKMQVNDPKMRCPNISKALRMIDWYPKVKIEEGLVNTIKYFQH